jgi:hypothetical protein
VTIPPLSDEQIAAVRRRLWHTDLGRWRLTLIDILAAERESASQTRPYGR